jgi:hypothetical protein
MKIGIVPTGLRIASRATKNLRYSLILPVSILEPIEGVQRACFHPIRAFGEFPMAYIYEGINGLRKKAAFAVIISR